MRFIKKYHAMSKQEMFFQSRICQESIKNNSTKFLTLSKLFANLDFKIVNVSLIC